MKKVFLVFSLIILGVYGYPEIVVISSFKGYSHIFDTNTLFFSDITLDLYGGNKYGGGIVITPYTYGNISNSIPIVVEKVEFFVNVLNLFKVYYWYGNKEYLGYVSSFQTRFYQLDSNFDLRGWYIISGTGINFDFSLLSEAITINTYFYKDPYELGIGNIGLKLVGRYRDIQLSIFSGISQEFFKIGTELKTFLRPLNAAIVVGVDRINLTNFLISLNNFYTLVEEKFNFYSVDNSWGFEQIMTLLIKPYLYKGTPRPSTISDIDIRLLIGLSFLRNILIGSEGIISIYGSYLPITQLGITSEVGGFVGFEENNILIKIQPMFTVLNSTTNQIQSFRLSVQGELRF
ncbi:MAG: hypothetical protein N2712_07195 [Brevinematales bacterium]|nr:hypothetical protein [Brevinematales bacterium]